MPRLNNEVTIGNLVSWALIAIGFMAGYMQMRGDVTNNGLVAKEARETAQEAQRQIYTMKTDIAVIKATTVNTDKAVSEIKKYILPISKQLNGI